MPKGTGLDTRDEVIDIGEDATEALARRRRAFLRVGLPVFGVLLIVASMLGIAYYADYANRRGALALTEEVLEALDRRIAVEVSAYLDPTARVALLMRDIVEGGAVGARRQLAESFAASALRQIPQIALFSFADSDGNYVMVRRGEAGGIDTKIIANAPGARRVSWIRRDADGNVLREEEDPQDTYDPRTRSWYTGALGSDEVHWSEVYVFFTDREPGLTASVRWQGPDGRMYVFGVDITLATLSRFLSRLEVGQTGKAMIVDGNGKLIAYPDPEVMLRSTTEGTITKRVDELGDPLLAAAYDRFRVEGRGRTTLTVGEDRYILSVSRIPAAARDWSVVILVPEKDFIGFVTANNRTALLMSQSVVALVIVFAFFLVRQGLRADRQARELLDRSRAITVQSAAFSRLATDANLFDPTSDAPPRALTDTLAEVSGARRASVWRLSADGRSLHCEDCCDAETGGHTAGTELHRDELPQFFAALSEGKEISVPDAAAHRQTAELHRLYMHPFGTRALLAEPVRQGERLVGVVWLEDATRTAGARDFLRAVANMVALRLGEPGAPEAPVPAPAPAAARQPPEGGRGTRSLTTELSLRALDPDTLAAEVYADVAVLVLKLTDPRLMAEQGPQGSAPIADALIRALQEIAAAHDVPYLKLMGEEIVAASGFSAGDADAALRLADAAVAIRDRCNGLLGEDDNRQEYRLGLDVGIAIGSPVGQEPRVFNLWGEAVRTAESMADTALPGAIQVTEAAYERLAQSFLFRPRGRFWLPRVGEAQTFGLVGRR